MDGNKQIKIFTMKDAVPWLIMRRLILYIVLSFLWIGNIRAEDGLQILKQAESTLSSISFSAKCDWGSGMITKIIQKKGKQNQFLVKKEVVVDNQGLIQTNEFLLNESGFWQILPNTKALRMDFLKINKQSAFFGLLENGLAASTKANYQVESKQIDGRELFIVTQKPKISADNQSSKMSENQISIGRDDHIIYGYSSKQSNGTRAKMTVTEFNFLENVPDDTFNLPAGTKEIICTNALEYGMAMQEAINAQMDSPGFKKTFQNYEKRGKRIRYVVLGVMLFPGILLGGYYLLRSRLK